MDQNTTETNPMVYNAKKKKKDYNKSYAYETLMICKKYGDEVLLGLTDT